LFMEKAPDLWEKWDYKTAVRVATVTRRIDQREKSHKLEIYPYKYFPGYEFYKRNNPSLFPSTEIDAPERPGRSPSMSGNGGTTPSDHKNPRTLSSREWEDN